MNNKCAIYKSWIFDFWIFNISQIGLFWSKMIIFIIEIYLKQNMYEITLTHVGLAWKVKKR